MMVDLLKINVWRAELLKLSGSPSQYFEIYSTDSSIGLKFSQSNSGIFAEY